MAKSFLNRTAQSLTVNLGGGLVAEAFPESSIELFDHQCKFFF